MPTQFNSPLYDGHFPETDAASVRILRHAGALIFGKFQSLYLYFKLLRQATTRQNNNYPIRRSSYRPKDSQPS
jgi:Asp-tRNA(Asn)/Glu-tRNA(Gln) amidotransferase A subunit family amidase